MGGPEKVERQHAGGKLTVRERIDALLDPGSFHEVGTLAGRATYEDGDLTDFTAGQLRAWAGAASTAGRWSSAATTSPCGAARPTPPSARSRCMAEQMANELRLPIVRLVDGTGGGGSVKSLDAERPHLRAGQPGLGGGRRQPGHRARSWRWPSARWPAWARPGWSPATTRVMVAGHVAGVRGRTAGGGPPRRARRQGGARRQPHPRPQRRGRRRGGHARRRRSSRTRRVPVVPAVVGRRPPAPGRARRTTPSGATTGCIGAIPRDRRKVYKVRPIIEAVVDRGSWLEIGAGCGPFGGHRAGPPRRLAGGRAGQRPVRLRRGLDGRRVARRSPGSSTWPTRSTCPVVHLVDQPGFLIGTDGRAGRRPSATAPGRWPPCTRRRCRGAR